jgi:hypothetical protein
MKTLTIPSVLLLADGIVGGTDEPRQPLQVSPEFAAVREKIAPKPEEELWKKIPWKTSLLEARQVAAKQGKPLPDVLHEIATCCCEVSSNC